MTPKKIAVILSGCGVMDGSEVHEAVTVMLAIEQHNAVYQCFAPEGAQKITMNHLTKQPCDEVRRTLVESARIARGQIESLKSFKVSDYDALVFAGGMGVVSTLCDFAQKGRDCSVNPDVERVIIEMHHASKPIVALCIAPVLVARVLKNVTVTIGSDAQTNLALKDFGANPIICSSAEVCIDKKNKIISTPCYMLDKTLKDLALSTSNAIKNLMELLK